MSDLKPSKKVFGRGRGKPVRSEGPWARSKKLDESHDVRPPKKDGEEFVLTESSFPPLPGAVNSNNDQFEDNVEDAAGTSQLNGGVTPDGIGHGKKLADLLSNRNTFESNKKTEKGEDAEAKSTQELKTVKDEKNASQEPRPKGTQKEKTESHQNGNAEQTQVKTDNHHITEQKRKPIIRQESDHDRKLRLEDLRSNKPSEVIYTKSGEKLLVKPSGRKFYINDDGTLGSRKFMLDDLRREFLYTQEHLANLSQERRNFLIKELEERKEVLLDRVEEILRSEDPPYDPVPPKVDITNSNLSPFAVEFVPRAVNMNPEAQDFVPTSNGNYDETNNNRSSTSSFNVNDTAAILADLEETVNFCYLKLIETPASYDELIGVVTPHFIKYMENPDLPNEIVQILYNYAIQDTRFAYFAIKILMHLIKMTCTEDYTQLRDTLLRHTQEEVQNTQNYRLINPETSCTNDIQPFLMFLSELYIQLEVGGRRLAMIGLALVETLKKLLLTAHIPLKERLRLIVNILKLTGLSLDQDNSTFLESLFTELAVVLEQESSNLDNPTVQFVNDIILLRNLRWGLVEPELEDYVQSDNDLPTSPNGNHVFAHSNGYDPSFDPNMGYPSGVFYGPDGNPIDYEEQLFLEVETNALNYLQIGDQGDPSPTSVEGFDEAYEEFLKTVPGHSTE